MKIRLITVSREADRYAEGICKIYESRIRHYISFEAINIRPAKTSDSSQQKKSDTSAILKKLKQNEIVVLLDERGDEPNSPDLAKWLENNMNKGAKSITFVIGGAYGVDDSIQHFVHVQMALSRLTLPHEIAKVVFVEQLYRAFTIIRNEKYHHE